MTRQIESDMAVNGDESHVANVGRLVEDMEFKMRNLLRMITQNSRFPVTYIMMLTTVLFLEEVYFGKAKDVVSELRSEYITRCLP